MPSCSLKAPRACPTCIYTIMFNRIPPAEAGGSFNPSLQELERFPAIPPTAGDGIPESFYAFCRSGMNHPPPYEGRAFDRSLLPEMLNGVPARLDSENKLDFIHFDFEK